MIGDALEYIRKRLDGSLRFVRDLQDDNSTPKLVVFPEGDKLESLSIPNGSIAMVVANIQEDREFRDPDRYQRQVIKTKGVPPDRHYPDIHLEFTVLFIANFKDYANAWNQLSKALFFFQQHPVFTAEEDSDLPKCIKRLSNELCTQTLQQQNELWGALRSSLRPSILVRFRLMTLRGPAMEEIKQVQVQEVITKTKGSLDMSVQELQKEFDKDRQESQASKASALKPSLTVPSTSVPSH